MNVLAFDTCFGATSVAVRWTSARGEILLREAYEPRVPAQGGLNAGAGHAERLMPMIEEVMTAARLKFDDLDRIAVTLGPGSFTGVRVGVAAARGLSLASGKPVVGLDTLFVMALRATLLLSRESPVSPVARPLVVAVDARRGDVYLAAYAPGGASTVIEPQVISVAAARNEIAKLSAPIVVGSGGALCNADRTPNDHFETALPNLEPHARVLAQCAPDLPILKPVLPKYLRAADAKPPGPGAMLVAG
jgi:tRNA threonylcarbamoyladenosine biosynthesis protein TsaB